MKLYYWPRTRAMRPRWMLQELSVPYDLIRVNLPEGEHKTPFYREIHPHGKVPAFVDDDGTVLFESAAICMYLADKYPEKGLAPEVGTPERGLYYQWMFYSTATLESIIAQHLVLPKLAHNPRDAKSLDRVRDKLAEIAEVLNAALEATEFLVGDSFTAADLMVGSQIMGAIDSGILPSLPNLNAYKERLSTRSAFKRALMD